MDHAIEDGKPKRLSTCWLQPSSAPQLVADEMLIAISAFHAYTASMIATGLSTPCVLFGSNSAQDLTSCQRGGLSNCHAVGL